MVSKEDTWVRMFDIPDVSKHKKGFTIYKVISMLYPESCPDAITKITVWKRYNDFKKLHRELKSLYRSFKIRDKLPSLPSASFFNRFDDEIIQERRQMILNFLEYISAHSQLFTSNCFVKFFETSHTPCTMLNSSINSIRADLNLPSDPEYLSFHSPESDDERTMSDTDSVSTMSSLSSSLHVEDPFIRSSHSLTGISKKLSDLAINTSQIPKSNNETVTDCISSNILSDLLDTLNTPKESDSISISNVSVSVNDSQDIDSSFLSVSLRSCLEDYVEEADRYIILGTRFEEDKRYDEAFTSYKQGISTLLDFVKGDRDLDRRHLVKYKIEKYLLRAEKIYNLYLSSEFKLIAEIPKKELVKQRPLSDLYKFKVIRVIGLGMLVIHSESQQLYYIKVIHKTSMCNNEDLILPTDVPFMVKMHNFYNCDNTVFLVLEYCSGLKFWDYVRQKSLKTDRIPAEVKSNIFESDNESECSFSELVNEYTMNSANIRPARDETQTAKPPSIAVEEEPTIKDDDDEECAKSDGNMNNLNVDEILVKSQELLLSVNQALKRNAEIKKASRDTMEAEDEFEVIEMPSQRKMSESSCYEDYDIDEFNEIPSDKVVRWAAQLLLALEKLHDVGIVCSDLKSNNVLINDREDLILTYMCKINGRRVFNYKTNASLAPEVYRFENPTPAADWWSFGTILYEMLIGMPISSTHPEGILSYTNLRIPKFVSAEGKSLLKQLLCYDPHKRLGSGANGTEEIKSHPFFNTIEWNALQEAT